MIDTLFAGVYFIQKAFWKARMRADGFQSLLTQNRQKKSYSPKTQGNLRGLLISRRKKKIQQRQQKTPKKTETSVERGLQNISNCRI